MTAYDFDKVVDRRHSDSLKYDFAVRRGRPADVLPLWVADMDFPAAQAITEALAAKCRHGVFGYSEAGNEYFAAVSGWYARHFAWEVRREWLTKTPGVVFALATAVKAYTNPGDAVLIQRPVYYPFSEVIESNGRRVVSSSLLLLKDGGYAMDFEDLESKIAAQKIKLLLLCSPHNPVGRVWTREELRRGGDICLRYGVIVVSDEIHSDLCWDGNQHTVFAKLGEEYANNCLVCTSPSKAFNIPGLQVSNIFIPNAGLRRAFRRQVDAAGYSQLNGMGLAACRAAYAEGGEWLRQVREYIRGNIAFTKDYLAQYLPQISFKEPQGTYLLWLDCRALGMSAAEREQWLWHKARLWLDSGALFGAEGEAFERLNVACPRVTLRQALERLRAAADEL